MSDENSTSRTEHYNNLAVRLDDVATMADVLEVAAQCQADDVTDRALQQFDWKIKREADSAIDDLKQIGGAS